MKTMQMVKGEGLTMTREDWIDYIGDVGAAIRFENEALSIGREFLPSFALAVLDGAEGSPEYWDWLARSLDDSDNACPCGARAE